MPTVVIQIVRFVDEHQPGFVECSLVDAHGEQHLFIEKVPVVTTEDLWSSSTYPRPAAIACQVEREWTDEKGQALVQINTELPWHIESTTGVTRFTVLSTQVHQ